MARYLADVSVLTRLHHDDVLARVGPLLLAGEVASCGVTALELGRGARGAEDHEALGAELGALPRVPVDDRVLARAAEVQGRLAERGRHRDVPVATLLVAAAAEAAGLVLLHDDDALAAVAEATGQPAERAAR